jgi:hypothetical protein
MYGFFSMPKNVTQNERRQFKNHMCSLCDSLHDNYGLKGRFFTNYDLTTISVLAAALDKSFSESIPQSSKIICTRFLSHSKPHELFSFFSAISIMLAYCKKYDDMCENQGTDVSIKSGEKIRIADNILSQYGLDKNFFESIIQRQHQYENYSTDIDLLSEPTGEMISQILTVMCKIQNLDYFIPKIRKLGKEIGKLVYVYDGIFDYQSDIISGMFNCIHDCFIKNQKPSPEIANDIMAYIGELKENISYIIDSINFPNDPSMLKKVLLKDITVKGEDHTGMIKRDFRNSSSRLSNKIVYAIISGSLVVQHVSAFYSPWTIPQDPCEWVQCVCCTCFGITCLGICNFMERFEG